MNKLLIAALLALPGTALAQTAPAPAPAATPAPAPKFTLDTPIQEIVADAQGKAVIDKNLPGMIGLPQYDMFKGLSLNQLKAYSDGKLTDEILAKTATDLAAIK
ncbi:hypothetical protein [Sphingomonas kyeonggiensis]|uniref:hypothetical protein n=2 Tax=Sphingomonadaceae TaxID=41297 RepID=UPI00278A6424|nr:hypothetical protein [Sphingomonas kyeonggiensis]MDQ0252616.1 hypothetical protein [Sphingomonas kyeonggiensis]